VTDVLTLLDLMRSEPAQPWRDGDNIPWSDPDFSRRMLAEHLSQEHDAASRRTELIEQHVGWIHRDVLAGRRTKILDLGCGPGLYASRLASLGHECVGVDYSPASIEHARHEARGSDLSVEYVESDIREADYGNGFGLVMLISGELNVFRPEDARLILRKAHAALDPGGTLLVEAQTEETVQASGYRRPFWTAADEGLFSDRPHVRLQESSWDDAARVATVRYFIIDAEDASVTRYAQSFQAYADDEYVALLEECGFKEAAMHASLTGVPGDEPEFLVLVAKRAG
jgi:SAM-dependent methyltransferase